MIEPLWLGVAAGVAGAGLGGLWLLTWRRLTGLRQRHAALEAYAATERQVLTEREAELARERATRAALEEKVAARRAEAEGYRAILDAAPFPIWRRDAQLALVWVNVTYARMVEATTQRVVDRAMELAPSLAPDQPQRLARRAIEAAARVDETRRFVAGGDRRVYQMYEAPLHGGGSAGFGQDVGAAEEARIELARHIAAHAEVLQTLATAISIWGPDKRLILFNRAYAQLWQLDDTWLSSSPHFSEVLERLREHRRLPEVVDWGAYRRAHLDLFTEVIEPREELMHLPDGRTFRSTITAHPFGGLLFAHHDVTDQLVLERARNTLIAVQRATLDNLFEGVAVFGGDGRLKLFNKAVAKLWDLPDAFLAGQPHIGEPDEQARRTLGDSIANWQFFRERVIDLVAERMTQSGRFERPDGTVIDYASVPLPDGALLFTFLDISAAVRVERALRERNEALQAADQLKSEFIANVSYELRTPLNTTLGFAEILHNRYFGELNERQMEYARGILDSSQQLLLLINDMLDLATIEAGHMTLERENFDLFVALENVVSLIRDRARRQSIELAFDCPADIGVIDADERRIKQVVFNLLNNAIKFTPPGGSVLVSATRLGDEIVIRVRDTGVGLPREDQKMPLARTTRARTAGRHPWAGLGLPLVRSFVELHGGHVELTSTPGQGTEVICYLPVAAPAEQAVAAS